MQRKRPEAWTNNTCMLHHDNAPAHASLLTREFLKKHETTVVPQPPYCPDLAPADFFLASEVKIFTKRSPISDGRGDRRKFAKWPSRHPSKHFPGRVPELENCWERCIKSWGEYFEGDKFHWVVSKAINFKKFGFFMDCPLTPDWFVVTHSKWC